MTDSFEIDFRGGWGGESPTTCAQHEQWVVQEANKPHDARFNLPILAELPDGTTLDAVRRALTATVERHEALRTTYGPGVQRIAAHGTLPVTVVDGPASRRDAIRARGRLMDQRIDYATEFPARFGVLVDGGRPRWLIGSTSHVTADMEANLIARRDFLALLAGGPALPAEPLQPRGQAAFERTERGQAILRRSHAAWRATLQRVPPLPLGRLPDDSQAARFPAFELVAKGLGRDLNAVAESLGARGSAPAVAAGATGIARALGVGAFPLKVSCNNRTTDRIDYCGMIAQQGLLPIDTVELPPDELIRRAWTGIIATARTSRYDSEAVQAIAEELAGPDARAVDHWINYVNVDAITDLAWAYPDLADGGHVLVSTDPVPFTTLRFGYIMVNNGTDLYLKVFGDRTYLPEETMRAILAHTHEAMRALTARVTA